ncbi:hypothetical protein CRUP_009981 [Coryphaenoides rupestris]|nr:hypothetical protein CRUP_009981 [Coryphaenoides rupestris]
MFSGCPSLSGNFKGMCKQIDHFPEDTDYGADPSEYFLREYTTAAATATTTTTTTTTTSTTSTTTTSLASRKVDF